MDWLNKFAKAANTILMIIVAFAAAIMLVSGLYVLNDIFYTNRTAFISYDLLKYRPVIQEEADGENYSFAELKEINPDTVGWIEMFGTNINYPVVQGNNNLEYLNKDIFGYSTLTGSIYLAAENNNDLSDWYNMIYGHHMDNGAMFGDIEKYLDPDYFSSHSDGIIQTENGDYSIHVFACVRTNAYEDTVYQLQDGSEEHYPILKEYISDNAVNQSEIPEELNDAHLLGMSTCADAVTDGRIVLFASVSPWDEAADGSAADRITSADKDEKEPRHLFAVGHSVQGGKWSFLNLMCVICTFLTLLPVWALRRKFGQLSYSRKMCRKLQEQLDEKKKNAPDSDEPAGNDEPAEIDEPADNEKEQTVNDLRHFLRKSRIGIIIEAVILIAAVIVFLMTEDITARMGIRDRWTGLMILIAAAALTVDIICLRYRGILPEAEEYNGENSEN